MPQGFPVIYQRPLSRALAKPLFDGAGWFHKPCRQILYFYWYCNFFLWNDGVLAKFCILTEWKCCPVNSNSDSCVPRFNIFVFSLRRNFISREVWKLIFLLPILFEGYQNMCSFSYLTCLRTFWILKSWHLPFLLYLKCVLCECVWESE